MRIKSFLALVLGCNKPQTWPRPLDCWGFVLVHKNSTQTCKRGQTPDFHQRVFRAAVRYMTADVARLWATGIGEFHLICRYTDTSRLIYGCIPACYPFFQPPQPAVSLHDKIVHLVPRSTRHEGLMIACLGLLVCPFSVSRNKGLQTCSVRYTTPHQSGYIKT